MHQKKQSLLRYRRIDIAPSGIVPAVVARILRRHSQSAAERLNARNRRRAFADDQRFNRILGFAGVE